LKTVFVWNMVHKSQFLLLIRRIMKCVTVNWIPEHTVLICSSWGWTACHAIYPLIAPIWFWQHFTFYFSPTRGNIIDLYNYLFALKHLRSKPKVCNMSSVYQILNIHIDQNASLTKFINSILDFSLICQILVDVDLIRCRLPS